MFSRTEDILSDAQASEFFPVGQTTFTDAMLTKYANQEITNRLVPHLAKVRQKFFMSTVIVPIRSGIRRYAIPERAIGTTFRQVWYLPDAADTDNRLPLTSLESEEVGRRSGTGTPQVFEVEGDEVILAPMPDTAEGALLFEIYRRPNELVPTASCARITGISSVGGVTTFTVDTDLSVSGGLEAGDLADLLSGKSPFCLWAEDAEILTVTSTTIEIATADVADEAGQVEPAIGDYLCPAQKAPIPMLPMEYHAVLAELVAWRAIKACGARPNLEACSANIKDMLDNIASLVQTRVETAPDLIVPRSGHLAAMQGW